MDKNLYLKIQRPSDRCLNCGADLVAAHKHTSAVSMDDSEEALARKDFCADCWNQAVHDQQFFSRWTAKREIPVERTRISKEDRNRLLLALFELLSSGGDVGIATEEGAQPVDSDAVRFFLGHLLMRFRVFKWHRTEAATGLIFFENLQNGETFSVPSVDLDDDTIVKIKQVVEEYLRKGQDLDVSL